MADPFSITGSAVGVISLGITVCQGLLRYYRQFKLFGEDVSDLTSQIESLDTILQGLQDILKKVSVQPEFVRDGATKIVLETIMRCQQKLQKLEILLEKCAGTAATTSLESKLGLNRLLYPFRRETLTSLMQTIGWLQSNLDTALQMLNISIMTAIQMQMTLITSLSTPASSNSCQILNVAHNLNYKHNVSVDKLAAIEQRLLQLESSDSSDQRRSISEPALLKPLGQSQNHDDGQDGAVVMTQYLQSLKLKCTCRRPGGAATFSQPVPHRPGCVYSPAGNPVFSAGRRWTIYNWLFKFRLHTSLEITKGSSGYSISPVLQFRAITPNNSPAFRLLIGVIKRFYVGEISDIDIQVTRKQLITLFQDGKASPYDTLGTGFTLLHVATYWISVVQSMSQFPAYRNLITSLIEMGVPPSVMSDDGVTPADNIPHFPHSRGDLAMEQAKVDLCRYLLNAGGYITSKALHTTFPCDRRRLRNYHELHNITPLNYSTLLLQKVANQASIEDFNLPEELIPLILRSKHALNLLLNRGVYMQRVFGSYAVWPEGLECLLQAGYSPGLEALCTALEAGCKQSIRLLINSKKFHLGPSEMGLLDPYYDPEIVNLVVKGLADRRKRLQNLAETHLPHHELSELNITPGTLLGVKAARAFQLLKSKSVIFDDVEETSGWLVYDFTQMGLKLANQLWDVGFRDVDEVDADGQSPLSRFKYVLPRVGGDFETVLEQITWLVAKGANLDRRYSNSLVLHRVAGCLGWPSGRGRAPIPPYNMESRMLIRRVFLDNSRDRCCCNCSVSGCTSLENMLRLFIMFYFPPLNKENTLRLANRIRFFGEMLGSTMQDLSLKSFYSDIAPRLLRSITFYSLGITHTCNCMNEFRRGYDPDDTKEIQDEQWYLIRQLDDLLDEFITKYSGLSDRCLPTFLIEYWEPRMNEVLPDQAKIEEVISEAREIGVVLVNRK